VNELLERLRYGAAQILEVAPAFLAAALILTAGYLVARQLQRWTDATLARLDFNRVAREQGIDEFVGRTGSRLDPVHAAGRLLFWLVMLVVILLASAALGLESINAMFGQMLAFLPTLIAGSVIVILGMIVGEFLRALLVARVAKWVVVLIAAFMALQQVGVSDDIVTSAFTLILGAVALAAGLAFGLGNRELAGEITRRWYEEGRSLRDEPRGEAPPPAAPPVTEPE
jgi:small-conductance mechanosensitive channel